MPPNLRSFLGTLVFISGISMAAFAVAADNHKSADHGTTARSATKPDSKSDSKSESRSDATGKAEEKADAKSELKSVSKVDSKSDPKLEQKMELKWSKKPEPKDEPRAEARYPRRVTTESAERESGAYRAVSLSGARPRTVPVSTITPETRRAALAAVARNAEITKGDAHGAEAASHTAHPPHWSYEGPNGPQAWARLAPEFAKCGTGVRQSPIDIREGLKVDLEPIVFEYRPSSFRVVDNGTPSRRT